MMAVVQFRVLGFRFQILGREGAIVVFSSSSVQVSQEDWGSGLGRRVISGFGFQVAGGVARRRECTAWCRRSPCPLTRTRRGS